MKGESQDTGGVHFNKCMSLRKAPGKALRLSVLSVLALCIAGLVQERSGAHTLPISYLQMVASEDYLHLELIFNPFELTFVSEADENKDGELSQAELKKSGEMVARRVANSLKVTVAGKPVAYESAGMDPDMSGHHVRLRAHYKVDARTQAVTITSELSTITSTSHIIQVRFTSGERQQLAQLDSRSKKATFVAPIPAPSNTTAADTGRSNKSTSPNKSQKTIP